MFAKAYCYPDFFISGRERFGKRKSSCNRGASRGWEDEQRTPRGDIKFILLSLLAEEPRYGYQLIKELENRYSGLYRPSPDSVYPTLQLLEEGGYLVSEQVEGKRVYTVTDSGRELLAQRDTPIDADREERAQELHQLKEAIAQLGSAVMQVARSNNLDRASRVREILNRAKREIYTILAEE